MGVEFLQSTTEQHDQVHRLIETLRASGEKSPELLVEPDGLEVPCPPRARRPPATTDSLLELFQHKSKIPLDAFLEKMKEQRQALEILGNRDAAGRGLEPEKVLLMDPVAAFLLALGIC